MEEALHHAINGHDATQKIGDSGERYLYRGKGYFGAANVLSRDGCGILSQGRRVFDGHFAKSSFHSGFVGVAPYL
jgi:hypothetical protein